MLLLLSGAQVFAGFGPASLCGEKTPGREPRTLISKYYLVLMSTSSTLLLTTWKAGATHAPHEHCMPDQV